MSDARTVIETVCEVWFDEFNRAKGGPMRPLPPMILAALAEAGFSVDLKDKSEADRVSAWLMHGDHTFTSLTGKTVADLVTQALMVHEQTRDGMLCPVIVLNGKRELRRVGKSVHLYSKNGDWQKDLAAWLSAVSADPDITRLLKEAANEQ